MSLELLDAESLAATAAPITAPEAVRRILADSEEVQAVRHGVNSGAITPDDITLWISELLWDLERGIRFPHDVALAALAVALEQNPSAFAGNLIDELSALRLSEIPLAPRVADRCKRVRTRMLVPTIFSWSSIGRDDSVSAHLEWVSPLPVGRADVSSDHLLIGTASA